MHNFHIIKGSVVKDLLEKHSSQLMSTIERAYVLHENKHSVNPPSFFLRFPDKPCSRIIGLPSAITSDNKVSGIKWIASNPDNVKKGLTRASAVVLLNDYETGFPLACLDGTLISAIRTAASAALALKWISKKAKRSVKRISGIGTGPIMQSTLQAILREQDFNEIEEITIFDLDIKRAQQFQASIQKSTKKIINFVLAKHINDAIRQSDTVIFATSALEPHVFDLDLLSHLPTILHLSLRDLSPEIVLNATNITDDIDHVLNAKTSLHLAEDISGTRDFIDGTIGGLVQNRYLLNGSKPIIFSPMGLGVLDLVLSQFIYHQAIKLGSFIDIEDFVSQDVF